MSLAESVQKDLGVDPSEWIEPRGYDSVALCLLDSIYSTGNHYSGVVNALNGYRSRRRGEGDNPEEDSAQDLVDAVERWGGVDELRGATNNWRAFSSTQAPYKADVAHQAALLLVAHGITSGDDVREHLGTPEQQHDSSLKSDWLKLPGQRSGLTWTYFLMLNRVPGVKADRMVQRFVARALGDEVTQEEAATAVRELADDLKVSPIVLDHAIWRHESGRSEPTT